MSKLGRGHIVLLALVCVGPGYGYDAPFGAQSALLYGSPKFISNANSAAGGGLFSEGSYSAGMNPALTAGLQCPAADLGYTALVYTDDAHIGSALRLGGSLPTRVGVFSLGVNGVFSKAPATDLGNIGLFRFGWARDVTENLYFGLSLAGGILAYDDEGDFLLSADLGGWYRVAKIAFLRNVRFALVLQNVGKTFQLDDKHEKDANSFGFPGVFTPKAGVAASLFESKNFSAGVSADLSFPTFISNIIFNAGLQISFANMVFVSAGWDFNLAETVKYESDAVHGVFIGLGVRFPVNTSNIGIMKKAKVNETSVDIDGVWQNIGGGIHLISAGGAASFGVRDILAPDIKVGDVKYQE